MLFSLKYIYILLICFFIRLFHWKYALKTCTPQKHPFLMQQKDVSIKAELVDGLMESKFSMLDTFEGLTRTVVGWACPPQKSFSDHLYLIATH